jgi:hypothetical protein
MAIATATLLQGCAVSPSSKVALDASTNRVFDISICNTLQECVQGAEIEIEKNAPEVEGHPLTSVVVTQCNLVVAVYMTMPDGRLVRFDHSADIPADELVTIAYTASRSERVEVSCEGLGAAGYETHGPT